MAAKNLIYAIAASLASGKAPDALSVFSGRALQLGDELRGELSD